jgi:hypothetical protein
MSDLEKISISIPAEGKVSITDAIKSVTSYENTLDGQNVEQIIEGLHTNKLFEPILAYYALSSLQNKKPINIYNGFSDAAKEMHGVSGVAYSDGEIILQIFPIARGVAKNITDNLFNLLDNQKEFTEDFLTQAEWIFFSEPELPEEIKTKQAFTQFTGHGLLGISEAVLFHEITHQVMKDVFKHEQKDDENYTYKTWNPYFNNDAKSEDTYHSAICKTLTNIKDKYLSDSTGSCHDLWEFGRDLATQLLGPEEEENDKLNINNIINRLQIFGKSTLGYDTLLSAFSSKFYSAETLDCEFIAGLPELDFITYSSEEAVEFSMAGRHHYCQHILPEVIKAIKEDPLSDRIIFDANQDFGCKNIIGETTIGNAHTEL